MGLFDFLGRSKTPEGAAPATPPVAGGVRDGVKAWLAALLLKAGLPPEAADAINAELIGAVWGTVVILGKVLRFAAAALVSRSGTGWKGKLLAGLLRLLPL